ncbi:helix-turn-helix domain-containing protein [Leucothrix arctica]|uniref:HTH cro/C1-type domain-containing protein n=1 Tax=Leucothrix arctica TaxID=1481894 RepID=A0A317CE75_9GAMM|nr:helix-turn-helix transcriptional regulator [Leucothrix arctica]PWQ96964.1 hypothetical protein DKT75_07965 [Leucothrix arctica]
MFELICERMAYAVLVINSRTKKSKKQIAEELEITPSALTQLTNGRTKAPSEKTLKLLKEKFGLNPKWVLNGDQNHEAFMSDEDFSNLREDIRVVKLDPEEKNIILTLDSFARTLDYIYSTKSSSITLPLIQKSKNWLGQGGKIRPLLASPIYLDNYSKEGVTGRVYDNVLFYLEGTPPKSYIIAQKADIYLGEESWLKRNRVTFKCLHVFDSGWGSIKLGGKHSYYYLDLSHKEYISIMSKEPPKEHIKSLFS